MILVRLQRVDWLLLVKPSAALELRLNKLSAQPNFINLTPFRNPQLYHIRRSKMGFETFLQDNVPQVLILGLALVGSSYLAGIIFSYMRLLASLFVLSGTNVRSPLLFLPSPLNSIQFYLQQIKTLINSSSANMARKAPGQSSPAPPTALERNTPSSSHKKASISSSSRALPLNSRLSLLK